MYIYQTDSGPQELSVPVGPVQEDYNTTDLAQISGIVNADLSTSVTITYSDGTDVHISTPAPVGAINTPQGSTFIIGNSNATKGPHYFDNVLLTLAPAGQ